MTDILRCPFCKNKIKVKINKSKTKNSLAMSILCNICNYKAYYNSIIEDNDKEGFYFSNITFYSKEKHNKKIKNYGM